MKQRFLLTFVLAAVIAPGLVPAKAGQIVPSLSASAPRPRSAVTQSNATTAATVYFYDAPYQWQDGNISSDGPHDSIEEVEEAFWAAYQHRWGVTPENCHFTAEDLSDGPATGRFAVMYQMGPSCNGGAYVVGTRYDYDPGLNSGSGAGCDGGEGHDGDGGGSGSGGDEPSCADQKGAPDVGIPRVGDPINPSTGNKYIQEDDFSVGNWLTFRRFYNSHPSSTRTAMGTRWSHSFERHIFRAEDANGSTIVATRPNGLHETFRKVSGVWVAAANNPDKLTETSDGDGVLSGYVLWLAALRHNEHYDANGLLSAIVDSTGQTETLSYSDSLTNPSIAPKTGLLLSVTAPDGRALNFSYDSSARLNQLAIPGGGTYLFGHDALGNLTSVKYPDGRTRQYVYNESTLTGNTNLPYAMTGIVDENGVRFEDTGFDEFGQALFTQFSGGIGRVSVTYISLGYRSIQYPLGGSSTQSYNIVQGLRRIATVDAPCGECNQRYKSRTYDQNGWPASYTDFKDNITTTSYDANGLITQEIDAKDTVGQRTIDINWNTALRVPLARTVKDSAGKTIAHTSWAYDDRGLVTASCLVDRAAAPSYICSEGGEAPVGVRRSIMTYCVDGGAPGCPLPGLLQHVDGPRTDVNDTLTYVWYETADELGCATLGSPCHRPGDLASVTDGAGLVTTYASYDKAGRPTRIRAPNGVLTDYTYTPRGWLLTKTVRANAAGEPSADDSIATIGYNPDGTVHQITDPDGVVTTFTYDAAHRLTDVTDGLGHRYHYTLDAAGNRLKEEVFDTSNALERATSRTFNALGQLTAIKDGLNRTVFSATYSDSYDANGNLVHSQDGLGIQRKQVFDGLDRLISTLQNYQGVDTATKDAQSVTSYDALDRVAGFSDPDGLDTTYDIDAFGNVTGLHSPDTGTTTSTFDIAGNRTSSLDANNVSTTSTFDALGRILTKTYADTSLNVQYKYDEDDVVTGCAGNYGKGHLTRIIESGGGLIWCYDGRGNVVRKQQAIGTTTTTTSYTWTLGNRLSSITTANGTLVAYTRDAAGNITAVTATPQGGAPTTIASNVMYKAFGPIASYRLGNGQTVTLSYDASGALTDIDSMAFSLHMKRDVLGNITAIGDSPGVATPAETYSYDPLYRLTGVWNPAGGAIESYSYNKTGDRLSKTGPSILSGAYTYAAGTHHLTSVGTTTREVDPRGNTTASVLASGTYGYGYNQRNRLTVVRKDGVTVGEYVLNALGQRVQKAANGVTTRFDYDESSRLLSEISGTASRDYIWLGGLPIGTVDRDGVTRTVAYVHADGLGTPRVVTDSAGAAIWQWSYASNPFGEPEPSSMSGYELNLRFPGQYFDAESGLSYNVNRDYEPATGRYTQSDPLGLLGGSTTFSYAGASPLAWIDPLGLYCLKEWQIRGIAGAAVGGIVGGLAGSETGPGAAVTAAAGALLNGAAGVVDGLTSGEASGAYTASVGSMAGAASKGDFVGGLPGAAIGGALASNLEGQGYSRPVANMTGATVGASLGSVVSGYVRGVSVKGIMSGAAKGGAIGLGVAAVQAGLEAAIRAGNNCTCGK